MKKNLFYNKLIFLFLIGLAINCLNAASFENDIDIRQVTVFQYCAFLNATAAIDVEGFYDEKMENGSLETSIRRLGKPGSYSYVLMKEQANDPVLFLSYSNLQAYENYLSNIVIFDINNLVTISSFQTDPLLKSNKPYSNSSSLEIINKDQYQESFGLLPFLTAWFFGETSKKIEAPEETEAYWKDQVDQARALEPILIDDNVNRRVDLIRDSIKKAGDAIIKFEIANEKEKEAAAQAAFNAWGVQQGYAEATREVIDTAIKEKEDSDPLWNSSKTKEEKRKEVFDYMLQRASWAEDALLQATREADIAYKKEIEAWEKYCRLKKEFFEKSENAARAEELSNRRRISNTAMEQAKSSADWMTKGIDPKVASIIKIVSASLYAAGSSYNNILSVNATVKKMQAKWKQEELEDSPKKYLDARIKAEEAEKRVNLNVINLLKTDLDRVKSDIIEVAWIERVKSSEKKVQGAQQKYISAHLLAKWKEKSLCDTTEKVIQKYEETNSRLNERRSSSHSYQDEEKEVFAHSDNNFLREVYDAICNLKIKIERLTQEFDQAISKERGAFKMLQRAQAVHYADWVGWASEWPHMVQRIETKIEASAEEVLNLSKAYAGMAQNKQLWDAVATQELFRTMIEIASSSNIHGRTTNLEQALDVGRKAKDYWSEVGKLEKPIDFANSSNSFSWFQITKHAQSEEARLTEIIEKLEHFLSVYSRALEGEKEDAKLREIEKASFHDQVDGWDVVIKNARNIRNEWRQSIEYFIVNSNGSFNAELNETKNFWDTIVPFYDAKKATAIMHANYNKLDNIIELGEEKERLKKEWEESRVAVRQKWNTFLIKAKKEEQTPERFRQRLKSCIEKAEKEKEKLHSTSWQQSSLQSLKNTALKRRGILSFSLGLIFSSLVQITSNYPFHWSIPSPLQSLPVVLGEDSGNYDHILEDSVLEDLVSRTRIVNEYENRLKNNYSNDTLILTNDDSSLGNSSSLARNDTSSLDNVTQIADLSFTRWSLREDLLNRIGAGREHYICLKDDNNDTLIPANDDSSLGNCSSFARNDTSNLANATQIDDHPCQKFYDRIRTTWNDLKYMHFHRKVSLLEDPLEQEKIDCFKKREVFSLWTYVAARLGFLFP